MTYTQVSGARKFAVTAFSGVVALSLMLPAQMAFADYSIGNQTYSGEEDKSGNGSQGGTWEYTAEGQQMNLIDYVGATIAATNQDLNIQLEGNNVVNGDVMVRGGDLTITGDETVDGEAKPSLDIAGEAIDSDLEDVTIGQIWATRQAGYDPETQKSIYVEGKGNVTISDANIKISASDAEIISSCNLTVKDSKITKNDVLRLAAGNRNNPYSEMLLQGSEIEASRIDAIGTLAIDNTNLIVTPNTIDQTEIDDGTYEEEQGYKWIERAVTATKGINLAGEASYEVKERLSDDGSTRYYLYTGEDYKIDLKASATPAYQDKNKSASKGTPAANAPAKGMPATSDTSAPMTAGLGIAAACAAALAAFSARNRKADE